ncbi:MAG: glycosyltransferase [Patescibacteria group bacterium]|nr:glycosyltransferase [Patescibacteria group bacterium]
MFFSIIIPTLNEERFLPHLLNDILREKYPKPFEVLIIDAFSSDKTHEIIKDYKKKLSQIHFFQIKKRHVSSQRNYGAKKAKGDYLIFLDADNRIPPLFLERLEKQIKKTKGLVFIPYLKPEKTESNYKPLFDLVNILVEFSQVLPKKFSLGGTMIVERSFFNLVGGFNEDVFISEDHEFVNRVNDYGVRVKFIKNPKVVFSLRRMRKEGKISFFYKYLIATTRRLFLNQEINEKIFEYEMGGQYYNKKSGYNQIKNFLFLSQIKKTLRKILSLIS